MCPLNSCRAFKSKKKSPGSERYSPKSRFAPSVCACGNIIDAARTVTMKPNMIGSSAHVPSKAFSDSLAHSHSATALPGFRHLSQPVSEINAHQDGNAHEKDDMEAMVPIPTRPVRREGAAPRGNKITSRSETHRMALHPNGSAGRIIIISSGDSARSPSNSAARMTHAPGRTESLLNEAPKSSFSPFAGTSGYPLFNFQTCVAASSSFGVLTRG